MMLKTWSPNYAKGVASQSPGSPYSAHPGFQWFTLPRSPPSIAAGNRELVGSSPPPLQALCLFDPVRSATANLPNLPIHSVSVSVDDLTYPLDIDGPTCGFQSETASAG